MVQLPENVSRDVLDLLRGGARIREQEVQAQIAVDAASVALAA